MTNPEIAKANLKSKRVVVAGCSSYGRSLAITLAKAGNQITIIDKNKSKLDELSQLTDKSNRIIGFVGDATIMTDLIKLDISDVQLFVCTTNSDSTNALAGQKAQQMFGVEDIVCLMSDNSRQKLYESLGIKVINHSQITSESLASICLET